MSLYSIFGFLQNRPTTTLAYYYLQQKSLVARMPGLDLYATRVFPPSPLPRLCCSPTGEEKALRGGGAIIQHFLRLEEEMGFEEEKVMRINKKIKHFLGLMAYDIKTCFKKNKWQIRYPSPS